VTAPRLVLSLFPGLGLLDRAFETEGFCVVRGPDVIWGGDVRAFHAPEAVFDGVIGGPPCQMFSKLVWLVRANGFESKYGNLIPEFERVCSEAQPTWFLMENVPEAPTPVVPGYTVWQCTLNNRWFADKSGNGARQHRTRRFSFGTQDGRSLAFDIALFADPVKALSVLGNTGGGALTPRLESLDEMCALQGLPREFHHGLPFTHSAKRQAIGNGVPVPMGRAVARAVLRAMGEPDG